MLAEFDLSDTEEIKRWIMSFGQHAVVLEPEQLRRRSCWNSMRWWRPMAPRRPLRRGLVSLRHAGGVEGRA